MNNKFGLTGVSVLFVLAMLAACGGGGGGDGGGSTAAPPGGGATTKTWGTAALIETNNAAYNADQAGNPQIAIDANGNALAVWWQVDVGCVHQNLVQPLHRRHWLGHGRAHRDRQRGAIL